MLSPKKIKHRKVHRIKPSGIARRGNKLSFGEFGLQSLEHGWLTARQIEASRIAMTRCIKRGGKVWIRVFPQLSITKKPAETRMGSGKGNPEYWVACVKPGTMLFEMEGVDRELAYKAFRLAMHKLPVKSKMVARADLQYK